MSAYSSITSPPQLPPISITGLPGSNMPYSSPMPTNNGSRPYSPYAPSPVGSGSGSMHAMSPPPGQYPGYGIPSYAAPTASSSGRLAAAGYSGQPAGRGYMSSPIPGAGMGIPPHMMMNGGYPQQQQQQQGQMNRPMSGGGTQVMKGTLRPGQEVTVGGDVVVVEKYLSEGGYAHVYLTHSARPLGPNQLTTHCLKRIAFDDSQTDMMADTKKEIEVMKQLRGGSKWIVEYLGSEMRRTEGRNGRGWEVFILMEFCAGGGILDLLNKRLRDRLKEREILDIFVDVCEAVAYMHALNQPLLHRDLKIENILCHPNSSSASSSSAISDFRFKLCDFGSTTFPADRPPRSKKEADDLAYDLNRHTTLQYRSPEMVEPLLGLPVGLPADVWALGVLLYKLCYYTTPFEEHGPLAIVNAKYTFPSFPMYSPLMQHLIASMLMEQPIRRPSVFDVLLKVHEMRGTRANPKYENMPEQRPNQPIQPSVSSTSSRPAVQTPAEAHAQMMASIQPQRRGRPSRGQGPDSPAQAPTQFQSIRSAPSAVSIMQLTGENPPDQAAIPQPRVPQPSASFDMDFGEAFKPGQQITSSRPAQPDLLDSIGEPTTASEDLAKAFMPSGSSNAGSKFTSSPKQSLSGFGDSFSGSANSAKAKSGSSGFSDTFFGMTNFGSVKPTVAPKPSHNFPSTFNPPPITRTISDTSSSAPNAEASFEDRFPFIEALRSGQDVEEATRPLTGGPSRRPTQSSETGGKSPLSPSGSSSSGFGSRPTYQGMSSFRASLTGDDSNSGDNHKSPTAVDGRPLPRSNHVTGSAFRMDSPSEERPTFKRMGSSLENILKAEEENSEPDTPTSPHPFPSSSQGAIRLADSPPPLKRQSSAPAKDLLTDDDSLQVKAGYLTMVPQQNGKSAAGRAPPPTANKPTHLHIATSQGSEGVTRSDEAATPRSASGTKPPPPTKPAALVSGRQQSFSDFDSKVSSASAKDEDRIKSGLDSASASDLKRSATEKARPQSMHPSSSTVSASSSLNALPPSSFSQARQSDYTQSTAMTVERPPAGPVRRSSINDIVSRFERMSSPPPTEKTDPMGGQNIGVGSGLQRAATVRNGPPPVASKPVGLGSGPTGFTKTVGVGEREDNVKAAPTLVKPVARYGRLATTATSEQASTNDKPTNTTTSSSQEDSTENAPKTDMKSRIAMWNQAGPPAPGSGPPAVKPKPVGMGRRL